MCGITVAAGVEVTPQLRQKLIAASRLQSHRGPDWTGVHADAARKLMHVHERLAIVDPAGGAQPLFFSSRPGDKTIVLCVNGEIYNHKQLRQHFNTFPFKTGSDCEPIIPLFLEAAGAAAAAAQVATDPHDSHWDAELAEAGVKTARQLNGKFSFVLTCGGRVIAARDPIGVTSLYYGEMADGGVVFASEAKVLIAAGVVKYRVFPPGHVYTQGSGLVRYYDPAWLLRPFNEVKFHRCNEEHPAQLVQLRTLLERAVVRRLMSDVPYGVLLSGGLDSSLVASIVMRHAAMRVEDDERSPAWFPRVHSFCIGLEDSPDRKAAKQVSEYLGTVHHDFVFTVQEALDAIPDAIRMMETYDVTTIRAGTPMMLMARKIKSMGFKMVLSGEGSDEIFAGYLYNHLAPSPEALHEEAVRKVSALHTFDCQRAHKAMLAWGVEARCPFLDKNFLDFVMTIDPRDKMHVDANGAQRIEKWVLRRAFDVGDGERPFLPRELLYRQKEQFSDAVGYNWIDSLKLHAASLVSDEQLASAAQRFEVNTPETKEAYFIRALYDEAFPHPSAPEVVARWVPNWSASKDASGRVQAVHAQRVVETTPAKM